MVDNRFVLVLGVVVCIYFELVVYTEHAPFFNFEVYTWCSAVMRTLGLGDMGLEELGRGGGRVGFWNETGIGVCRGWWEGRTGVSEEGRKGD